MIPHPSLAQFSLRSQWAKDQAISFLMQQAVENRDVLSLAAGLVDEKSLPVFECRTALTSLFHDDSLARQALQYGTTAGADALRVQLRLNLARLEHCSADELNIDQSQMILTTGSQQLLSLVADVLLDPGDICLVAAPTYFVFLGVLSGIGARAIAIETDEHGLNPQALDTALARLDQAGERSRVKLIYVVSDYENPSGVSLATPRRCEIVAIARKWSRPAHPLFVLEDAAYRELRYDGADRPSVWSFDESRETVILAQTFSKSFAPGVRIGMGILPKSLVEPICNLKGNDDFGSANLNQHLLALVMSAGDYEPHVCEVRDSYRRKRDTMLAALDLAFSGFPEVRWLRPEGGLYVWVALPKQIDTGFSGPLFQLATKKHHVMYVPGELCYPSGAGSVPTNQMRLCFGVQDAAGITEGVRRLAAAVIECLLA